MAKRKGKISVETSGKRKTAIARATVRKGQGRVRVNSQPIHIMEPTLARRKALEPVQICLLYTSPSPRDGLLSRMPSSA